MCGIAAIFNYRDRSPVDRAEMGRMLHQMQRRGPDGSGEWYGAGNAVGLGHRRLSIIDLSENGAQPMASEDGRHVVIFNGEIYNYRELRSELKSKGCGFRSNSDTEILLHLYRRHGREMLSLLRGMFAFAIWDGDLRGLLLARDPFGIKPLYYSDDGSTLRCASQVKALLAGGGVDTAPEPAGHVGFFLWGHVPEPFTLHEGISALPAGGSLWVDQAAAPKIKSFFSVPEFLSGVEKDLPASRPDDSAVHDLLRATLLDSVQHHLIADVPVGVFLSSGLDSTTLTALAAESSATLKTVTLGFEEFRGTPNDETLLAEEVARSYGASHQTIWVRRKDFEVEMHHLLEAMDQPSSDGVNSYFISKAAAETGLKVAISGLGGDEHFGSYPSFSQVPRLARSLSWLGCPSAIGRSIRVITDEAIRRFTSPKYAGLFEYGGSYAGAYLLRRSMFMPWELPRILDPDLVKQGWQTLQTILRLEETVKGIDSPHLRVSSLEMCWYMRNQLLRDCDWAGMAHSLEVRVPLVDVELLQNFAPLMARDSRPSKRDMALCARTRLPESVLNKPKTGFTVPVREWLMSAFDSKPGRERGLRGWTREVYSVFADSLEFHRHYVRGKRRTRVDEPAAKLNSAATKSRICVLLTDGFGGFGGIAKFNRDFLNALCSHEMVEEVVALPRLMPNAPEPFPPKLVYDTSGLGGKLRYLKAALAAVRAGSERRASLRFDLIICAHINLLPVAMALRFWLPGSCPVYLIVHGIDAWQRTENRLANACVRRVDGFITVSNVTKRRFMLWSGLRDAQGVVLPNCVDLSAFGHGPKSNALLQRYRLHGKRVLLTLGRLASEERYKGFDEVLEAMPELLKTMPDLCYLICGDGQDRGRLVAKARSLGLTVLEANTAQSPRSGRGNDPGAEIDSDAPNQKLKTASDGLSAIPHSITSQVTPNVVFAGRILDSEKADHFRLADLYIMPSSGEGFGIVFLEAMACGIPVVGSRVDGGREALLNGKLGRLVDPRDREEILKTVHAALEEKPHASHALNGESVEYFSSQRFKQRVHEIFDCLLR